MKRLFYLPLLLLFLIQDLVAQDSTSIDLVGVIITENRLELPFSDVSRTINIIDKKQIETAPVQSLPELLNYVAGIDIRQRGVHGVQADVGIRGGSFDQTLVLKF